VSKRKYDIRAKKQGIVKYQGDYKKGKNKRELSS
jgi:hypothetical protein